MSTRLFNQDSMRGHARREQEARAGPTPFVLRLAGQAVAGSAGVCDSAGWLATGYVKATIRRNRA
jgi:hypothetical protein